MTDPQPKPLPLPLPVHVQKPTPYTFDLGLLLASDPNPLHLTPSSLEDDLASTARDGAQALLNQLLSTCPIASTPAGVLLSLPAISTDLPREKPLPAPKALTTWQKFAAKKGIKAKTSSAKQNMQYNAETGEWERKWGYKGANKAHEQDWIVEVDVKKERERMMAGKEGKEGKGGGEERTWQGDSRRERKEKVRRNERLMRANERKGGKGGGK